MAIPPTIQAAAPATIRFGILMKQQEYGTKKELQPNKPTNM